MHNCYQIPQQLGDYSLLQQLGKSDFSEVYLAEHMQQHTQVAIKLLPGIGDNAEEFLTRSAQLVQLRHPHVVPMLDFGAEDDCAFLVMDYIPGGTLRQRYPQGVRVPFETILPHVRQITAALQYVHERGLVHRDIKPQNILLSAEDTLLLSDFGTAVPSYTLDPSHTYDFEGTVLYAAPEQLHGRPQRSSDQYALGAVLYEWISGVRLFSGTFHEIAHQHLFVTPPTLQTQGITCPSGIEQVIRRALEKEPQKRFSSVKIFAEELEWAWKVAQAKGQQMTYTTAIQSSLAHTEDKRQFKLPQPFARKMP